MPNEIQSTYNLPLGYTIERFGLVYTLTEDGWRAEVKHSMMRRCKGWDYCRPWIYLVTIGCQHHDIIPMPEAIPVKDPDTGTAQGTRDEVFVPVPSTWHHSQWLLNEYTRPGRPHLFGELTGNTEQEATIALNPFGKVVEQTIMSIETDFPQVRVMDKIVMPNHIHFLVHVVERLPEKKPLGYVIDRFKSWINRRYKEICLGLPANTVMDISYQKSGLYSQPRAEKTSVCTERPPVRIGATKQGHGSKNPKIGLVFEAGFHDRILFREGQLRNMIDYCRDNPRRLWKVVHNSQYFHTVSGIRLTMPMLADGGTKGRGRWNGAVEGLLAPIEYMQCGNGNTAGAVSAADAIQYTQTITFNAIGNRELLKAPERMQIQCSRSMSEADIETLKADVIEACKHGVVPISPCISPGERAVARAVMEAGYKLIALFPQGIPGDTTYKPYKEFFDACANGQLLLLSPWKFEMGVNHLARWQCLFLNDIAMQLMTGLTSIV